MMSQQKNRTGARRARWPRIVWIILRNLLVPVLCVCGLLAGLAVGYAYIGGQPVSEVFSVATWKHLVDLVFAN